MIIKDFRMHYIPFQISISSIFDAKILKRRRFLQHYYRNASTEDITAERSNKLVNRYIYLRFSDEFLDVPKNEERWQYIAEHFVISLDL